MLKAIHDTIDDIPEQFRELYTEKGGKFELTGITGVKTQADIDRLQTALTNERNEHKETKDLLGKWTALGEIDDIHDKLDKFPELEAASQGKLDEAQIEEIVTRRVDGTIKSRIAPLERQITQLTGERDEAVAEASESRKTITRTKIHDAVRSQLVANKVINEAMDDALMHADRIFEIREDDGAIVARDQVGVTPGIAPDEWLTEMKQARPHWFPSSQGGGAGGNNRGPGAGADNPWTKENWNITKQHMYTKQHGREKAAQLAKMAGSELGASRPVATN